MGRAAQGGGKATVEVYLLIDDTPVEVEKVLCVLVLFSLDRLGVRFAVHISPAEPILRFLDQSHQRPALRHGRMGIRTSATHSRRVLQRRHAHLDGLLRIRHHLESVRAIPSTILTIVQEAMRQVRHLRVHLGSLLARIGQVSPPVSASGPG